MLLDAKYHLLECLPMKSKYANREEVLKALTSGELKIDEASAELANLDYVKSLKPLEFVIGNKRNVSIKGLQRFPVTLYANQWTRILDAADDLRKFIETNKDKLDFKGAPSDTAEESSEEPAEKKAA